MPLRNFITEKIILPGSDIARGTEMRKMLDLLLETQFWSRGQLEEYQNRKLQKLIRHAYENTAYYRELFDGIKLKPSDIKTADDLIKIPVLSKSDIRKNFPDRIVARNIPASDHVYISSSGSTGEPLTFARSKHAHSIVYAANIRGWYWMGFRLGDKYVKLSQNPRNSKIKKIQDRFNNCKYLFSQQLIDENFEHIVKEIRNFRPKVLRGYPDPLFFLSQYIKRNGIDDIQVPLITTTGNILFPEARKLIEEQFHGKIFDSYSCEGGAIVAECPTHECYHSAMEYAISELVDENNQPVQGERGRLLTTDLDNFATPFIRYDTKDILVRSDKECSCGRGLMSIEKIEGRDNDILITPSGKFLIVHNFTGFFEFLTEVDGFQVYQKEPDYLIIRMKINDTFTGETMKAVQAYWLKYIGNDMKIEYEIVDEIEPSPSGKRRFLIRDKSIPLVFGA